MPEIRAVAETGSTNDDLAALAAAGAAEGLWLRADRQTGGKGRQGRAWQSPPGNLYASTLVRLRPNDPPAATLALVAAVALHETVRPEAPAARIKWPNDLLVDGAKLAGILLERQDDAVVIGFGVNLAFHPDLADRPATSLTALAGRAPGPHAFLTRFAPIFEAWLGRWRADGLAPIRAGWLAAAHPVGTPIATGDVRGTFDGLDESGALRLRLPDGALRMIHAGDVFLI
jgi:BirA family biotin operon repressor/biotin-[acetyl-CoA-carboxylase] ligase